MDPTRHLAQVYLLSLPVPVVMWLEAFQIPGKIDLALGASLVLVLAGTVASTVAVARALGSQYEMRGRRSGLLLASLAIMAYLTGSFLQNDMIHIVSVLTLYWGLALCAGGTRVLLPVLPGGLFVLSLFALSGLGLLGLAFVDALSWAAITTSSVMMIRWRGMLESIGCGYCTDFQLKGESFCRSCGRMVGRVNSSFPPRTLIGLVAFAIVMMSLLALAVPLLVFQPSLTPTNIGLGGPHRGLEFAPLPGWVSTQSGPSKGSSSTVYDLTNGETHLKATIAVDPYSSIADLFLKSFRGNISSARTLPSTLDTTWNGYTVTRSGTPYVVLQGIFKAGALNDSGTFNTLLAVDLRQTSTSFQADNGSALYGAAKSVSTWATASGQWAQPAGTLLSTYALFSQVAYLATPTMAVGVLFTLASDDERSKAKRLDSIQALPHQVVTVLGAFGSRSGWVSGQWLLNRVAERDPYISDSAFFSALTEAVRRGVVSKSIVARNGRPTLGWRSLLR